MTISSFTLLGSGISVSRVLGIIVWSGLVGLTLALLVLVLTRWGQSRPLRKCVGLSVFAHLLFLVYAYGTNLFFDIPPGGSKDVLVLTISAADDSHEDDDAAMQPDRRGRPWERYSNDSAAISQAEVPLPRESPTPDISRQRRSSDLPEVAALGASDQITRTEPLRPSPEHDAGAALRGREAAPTIAQADVPTPSRQFERTPDVPTSELDRADVNSQNPVNTAARQGAASRVDGGLLEPSAHVQQLADVLHNNDPAQARSSPFDVPRQASQSPIRTEPDDGLAPVEPRGAASAQGAPDIAASQSGGAHLVSANQGDYASIGDIGDATTSQRRLGDGQPLPQVYQARTGRQRLTAVQRFGGNRDTEAAVEAALAWLAHNQSRDGRWSSALHGGNREDKVLGHDRQSAGIDADTGITGLSLLAFLGAGHTHLEGDYRENVRAGVEYLIAKQRSDGCLAGDARLFAMMYCHGMATLALSEAYAMTGDAELRPALEKAVQFTIESQHATSGGWRYQPGDQGDLSQFGWQVMALTSAERAGIEIPQRTRDGMLRFLQSVSAGANGGLGRYRPGERPSHSMTAEGLTCRFFLDSPRSDEALAEASRFVAEALPADGKANYYYWYYGTIAAFQLQDDLWKPWNDAMTTQLLKRQRYDGDAVGSWDPDSVWGGYGGRAYSTAMAALCLEVYYRYLPLYSPTHTARR
jgi:hypothetical protein